MIRSRTVCLILSLLSCLCVCSCGKKAGEARRAGKPANLTVLFSSDLLGKVRSCGCADKDMGGLPRRATYIEGERASFDNLIVVDVGDMFGAGLGFSKNEAELAFESFSTMGCDAFTPGETDFVFGVPFLKELAERATFDMIAANVVDAASGQPLFGKAYVIKELKGGLRVGIIGVLDEYLRFPAYINTSAFKVLPAVETLRRIVPELKRQSDFLILLSHAGIDRSKEIAREIPDFALVAVGHGKPIIKDLEKSGETIILATGGEGQYLGRIDLKLSRTGQIIDGRMRLVPIDESIELHPGIKELFKKYGVDLTEKEVGKR